MKAYRRGRAREIYIHLCRGTLIVLGGTADTRMEGEALAEASQHMPPVSGCERQEVKGTSGAETQDV